MKNKIFIGAGIILISIILTYLYSQLTIFHLQEKFKEYRKTIYLDRDRARANFDLPSDTYLLKVKHTLQADQPKEIFVNGFKVDYNIYPYVIKKGIIETDYIRLPKEIVKEGRNLIDINFPKNHPKDVDTILSNYRRQIGNDIYILFSDSAYFASGKISFKTIVSSMVIISLVFAGVIYFLNRTLSLSINRLFIYQIYSLLPFFIFLFSLWLSSNLSKLYKVVTTNGYFWTFGIVSFSLTQGFIILRKLIQGYRKKAILLINPKVNKLIFEAIEWIKLRDFSDKCIMLFMVLFMVCALLLILHFEPIAVQVANIIYFVLVIGVITKFIRVIKEREEKI